MDWLGKLLGLPQQFLSRTAEGSFAAGGGVIQGTASEATLVCMLAARARAMQGRPASDMAKLVAYTSDQAPPHFTSTPTHPTPPYLTPPTSPHPHVILPHPVSCQFTSPHLTHILTSMDMHGVHVVGMTFQVVHSGYGLFLENMSLEIRKGLLVATRYMPRQALDSAQCQARGK